MDQIQKVTAGNKTYNVVQASAVQQKSLLLMVGAIVAYRHASSGVKEISVDFLKGALISMPEETIDKIIEIVLHKTVLSGSNEIISIDSFQGGMNEFFTLVAGAVKVNLDDFFTSLESAQSVSTENEKKSN